MSKAAVEAIRAWKWGPSKDVWVENPLVLNLKAGGNYEIHIKG